MLVVLVIDMNFLCVGQLFKFCEFWFSILLVKTVLVIVINFYKDCNDFAKW